VSDDEPSVMGAGCYPPQRPTQEDYKRVFKKRYIELFLEVGVSEEVAASWFDDGDWEDMKTSTP
jgi:hypothetical protein